MNVYFRIKDDTLYETVRLSLDSAWGHEPPVTCVDPAATAPRNASGHILLAVRPEFVSYAAVQEVLPGLLAGGLVEQISENEYAPVWPTQGT